MNHFPVKLAQYCTSTILQFLKKAKPQSWSPLNITFADSLTQGLTFPEGKKLEDLDVTESSASQIEYVYHLGIFKYEF